jgi:hypothetical protein
MQAKSTLVVAFGIRPFTELAGRGIEHYKKRCISSAAFAFLTIDRAREP